MSNPNPEPVAPALARIKTELAVITWMAAANLVLTAILMVRVFGC